MRYDVYGVHNSRRGQNQLVILIPTFDPRHRQQAAWTLPSVLKDRRTTAYQNLRIAKATERKSEVGLIMLKFINNKKSFYGEWIRCKASPPFLRTLTTVS